MLELLAFLETEPFHDFRHSIGRAEVAHEIVFKAHIKPRRAWIALTGATPTKLPVDPTCFVTFGSENEESTHIRYSGAKFNVGAAASHVRGNRHRSRLTGPRDNLGFLHVKLRVEHVVRNFFSL